MTESPSPVTAQCCAPVTADGAQVDGSVAGKLTGSPTWKGSRVAVAMACMHSLEFVMLNFDCPLDRI